MAKEEAKSVKLYNNRCSQVITDLPAYLLLAQHLLLASTSSLSIHSHILTTMAFRPSYSILTSILRKSMR